MKALVSSFNSTRTFSLSHPLLLLFPNTTNPRKTLIITKMSSSSSSSWTCKNCTFINPPSQTISCEICLSPSLSPSPLPPKPQWPCKTCTFLNPITRTNCEMCGARDSSSLSRSFEVDDVELLGSGVGSVFFPLRACNNKRKIRDDEQIGGFWGSNSTNKPGVSLDSPTEIADDDAGGRRGIKALNKSVVSLDDVCDEKGKVSGVKSDNKAAIFSEEQTESKILKVLSYNVWFREDLEMHKRMKALGDLIRLHSPDIICLQEVTPNIYNVFQKSSWWNGYYCSVTNDMAITRGYFCMQLSKIQVKSFSCKPFNNSIMGRELCIADLEVEAGLPLVIATTHLESPCPGPPKWDQMYSKERVEQANKAIDILKQKPNAIFCGDMNWDDKLDGQFPLPDGWVDAWMKLRSTENGWTYDTKSNQMLSGNRALQKRLDRFLCKFGDFEIKSIEMIGMEAIPGLSYIKEKKVKGEVRKSELPVLPSDHYGLLLTLSFC